MRYTSVPCAFCGRAFNDDDDVVVCPICGAPHHRKCWLDTGRCALSELHEDGFVWTLPELPKPADEKAPQPQTLRNGDGDEVKLRNGEAVVQCPQCGASCYQNDIYCLRCGTKLDGTADPYGEDGERVKAGDPYYRNFRYDFEHFGGISPEAPVDGIPCMEYADFVGGGKPGRIIRKVSTMERYDKRFSWSWAALFLGPIWFFWRKMNKEGAVIAVTMLFLAALFGLLQINQAFTEYSKYAHETTQKVLTGEMNVNQYNAAMEEKEKALVGENGTLYSTGRLLLLNSAEYLRTLALPLICALIGIPLYRKHVRKRILRIREQCSDMNGYREALLREGGTSAGGAVLGVAVFLASVFCVNALPFLISVFVL